MESINNDIRFTTITICYNAEKTIRRTIESVLNQTDSVFEYIIVDGFSDDDTLNIIKEYEGAFRTNGISYKFISEPDKGIADAFNKGINMASGDIIGIINADDWYCLNTIEIVRSLYSNSYDIYCGRLDLYEQNGKYVKTTSSKPYLMRLGMYIKHPTVFVRKIVYDKLKYSLDYKIAMDFDFMLRAINGGAKIKRTDKVLASMSFGGISCNIGKMRIEERTVARKNNNIIWYFLFVLKKRIETFYFL